MHQRRHVITIISLAATIILSCTVLPLAVPPFGGYPAPQVVEVLLWQAIATIGWPFAIFSTLLLTLTGTYISLTSLLPTFLYPAILALTARVFISRSSRAWELVLLHLLLVTSFVAIWYSVRNGYDIMVG